ncbi:MAG: DUF2304 domain-containing protein [Desulfobacteraceae bacterium]|nr:DUF2304 domain-containing protein [Desulfobacteraceae bacterium]
MKITPISLFIVFAAICMIGYILNRLKNERTGIRAALVWMFLWGCAGFFSLFPGLLNWATRFAHMENRIIFVLLVAVFILFALLFNISTKMEKMQRNIEKLVQEIALTNYKVEQPSKDQKEDR